MKLSAIISRATNKDYVDFYYLLKDHTTLRKLLQSVQVEMPDLDENLVLKSLVYFEGVTEEPLKLMDDQAPSFAEVKEFLQAQVREYEQQN